MPDSRDNIILAPDSRLLPPDLLCRDSYAIGPLASHTIQLWRVREPKRLSMDMPAVKSDLWAHVWAASLLLAHVSSVVIAKQVVAATVLDIGTGMGISSIALAQAGAASVVATDFAPEALEMGRLNAELNGISSFKLDFRYLNWHEPLDAALVGRFDIVVGADVTYMRNALGGIVRVIGDSLLPGGVAVIVDAGRPMVEDFEDLCFDQGLVATHYDLFKYQTAVCILRKAAIIVVTKGEPSQRSVAVHQHIAEFCKMSTGAPHPPQEIHANEFGCCQKT
ncbi:hypothetical protein BASA61_006327 [Batrachochytrium salamandrivorans]|nr:hypothetical protein BASA60_010076 [Batrachochytrium salamandrivorans]KAH6587379.1 hypothetical protein BASA61_006327 [Batrachochytrium salamandrivorans]KAH9247429.1 hypothetical protein BASA81_014964 [Batrachochytrium salamandrivorans]KAH9272903.1 hypothetical protein BASA83_004792 [Batrachochytrium salamandrivorans]KAJ1328355.1 hypothetical protein BSLG_010087 [Batrachochytrium salamandrivorans]